jgi:uncharacterized membrane protein YoaK (UPF0700 family)
MEINNNSAGPAYGEARAQQRLMMFLAMIAGYCDSYGLLHFKTYVSFMSGNSTQTGFALGRHNYAGALIAFTAILFFCLAVLAATLLAARRWYLGNWMTFIITASLLAACAALPVFIPLNKFAGVALLSFAIGYLNNALTHVGGQSVNPDFVTGNLNNMMKHFASAIRGKDLSDAKGPWDTHFYRACLLFAVWSAFVAGALICSGMATRLGGWTLIPVIVILLLCPFYVKKRTIPLG